MENNPFQELGSNHGMLVMQTVLSEINRMSQTALVATYICTRSAPSMPQRLRCVLFLYLFD